jgi:hypothetical protein
MFKVLKGKTLLVYRILPLIKCPSEVRGKISYSQMKKSGEFVTIRPALQQVLQGALQGDRKDDWAGSQSHGDTESSERHGQQ